MIVGVSVEVGEGVIVAVGVGVPVGVGLGGGVAVGAAVKVRISAARTVAVNCAGDRPQPVRARMSKTSAGTNNNLGVFICFSSSIWRRIP